MENKAVQVIDGQIAEINDKILNTKIAMADLILNIHFTDFKKTPTTNELFLLFDEMDKLPKLIVQYNENKSRLDLLNKTKTEIEQALLEDAAISEVTV